MAKLEVNGFGWFSKNQKAVVIRELGDDGKLKDTGIVFFMRDFIALQKGELKKLNGDKAKSFKVFIETPYEPKE